MNFNSILCAQELKNLSHLKEKLILKFIKPINNQRPNHYIKTDSLASKILQFKHTLVSTLDTRQNSLFKVALPWQIHICNECTPAMCC